jgi:hypothetical protein
VLADILDIVRTVQQQRMQAPELATAAVASQHHDALLGPQPMHYLRKQLFNS